MAWMPAKPPKGKKGSTTVPPPDGSAAKTDDAPAADKPAPPPVTKTASSTGNERFSGDPVAIHMRQLRQVPLLSREAEVSTARRLEDARLDMLLAAARTGVAGDELNQTLRQIDTGRLKLIDDDKKTKTRKSLTRAQAANLVTRLVQLSREIDQHQQQDEPDQDGDELLVRRRDELLDLVWKLPFREGYLEQVTNRIKDLAARLHAALGLIHEVEKVSGLHMAELMRPMRDHRRGVISDDDVLEATGLWADLLPPLCRQAKNAQRRIRDMQRKAKASTGRILRSHREMLEAEARSQRAKDELVLANQRLVVHIASRYLNRGMPFLELVQEGNLGLMRAVDKFDYRRGYKFSTYGTWWIRHAVNRAIANQSRTIRLPVHVREEIRRLVAESRRYVLEHGHEPTTEELARRLDIRRARVEEIMEASRKTLRWELPVGEDGETELGTLISDKDAPSPFEEVSNKGQWEQITQAMESTLKPREREVLVRRFGLDGRSPQTLEDVGKQLGITRERVRQIQARAMRCLQVEVRKRERLRK